MSLDPISYSDDDELISRSVQGTSPLQFTPEIKPALSPNRISSLSTIKESDSQKKTPQHSPTLPPPRNPFYSIISTQREMERLNDKCAKNFEAQVAELLIDIKKLQAEREEALQKQAEEIKSQKTWSVLATVAQYVASAGIIIFGVTTLATAPWAGGLLIASGSIGLTRQVLHDTSALETIISWWIQSAELQQKIARNIDMGMFLLQMGLGLCGGIWAYKGGALSSTDAKNGFAAASGVLAAATQVGVKYHEKKISDLKARLKEIGSAITSDQYNMTTDGVEITKMLDSARLQADEIRKAIQATRITVD